MSPADFNLHPVLSSLPLGLLVTVVIVDFARILIRSSALEPAVRILTVVACVAVVGAFFSGYEASETASRTFVVPEEAVSRHHTLGRLLLFAIFPWAALRWCAGIALHGRALFWSLYGVLTALVIGLVGTTGYLGGELVFRHGAGVYARPPVAAPIDTPQP